VDKVDLAIGNPEFYKEYWEFRSAHPLKLLPEEEMSYLKEGALPDLKFWIKMLHAEVQNADIHDKHIVVGNGATQLLFAAMAAFPGPMPFYWDSPYWFRIPAMVNMAWHYQAKREDAVGQILTIPNNPTNDINQKPIHGDTHPYNIYDMCYNWPQYGNMVLGASHPLMIFSFAKITGHAGSRIGWALVSDKTVAENMTRYIEYTTGGVSRESQRRTIQLIQDILPTGMPPQIEGLFFWAKRELKGRWKELLSLQNLPFKILNTSGMFGWCEIKSGFTREDLPFTFMPGEQCGGTVENFRINMGVRKDVFNEFIDSLK
jgi:L-tryptophan--pyruvate aminotransferase